MLGQFMSAVFLSTKCCSSDLQCDDVRSFVQTIHWFVGDSKMKGTGKVQGYPRFRCAAVPPFRDDRGRQSQIA